MKKDNEQKLNYLYNNPVVDGYVYDAYEYKYSSAIDYAEERDLLMYDYWYKRVSHKSQTCGSVRKYSATGSIENKNQNHESRGIGETNWNTRNKTSYNWDYKYEGEKPHAPSQIGENEYTYDANGNQTGWHGTVNNQRRDILWDEENRIRAIAENGATHHYMYDASGERVIKATGDGQAIYINGFPMGGSGTVGSYTMYVNPYMVVSNMNFTKHFYIEGQRIVSKLGEGGAYQYLLNSDNTQYVAGGDTINLDKKLLQQKDQIIANFEDLGMDGIVFTAGKSGKTPYGQIKKYYREQNGDGATHVKDTTKATANANEKFRYFYHPDHLGSSSYITDASGEVYQHFEYFPFGETFVEDRYDHHRTPYLYNGKELDKETGLYYYGARYYDPRISMWYGVDPLMDKYQGLSPYINSGNNPIIRFDVDGKDWIDKKAYNAKGEVVSIERTLTFSIVNNSKTLTSEDVNSRVEKLTAALEDTYSGKYKDKETGNTVAVTTKVVIDQKESDYVLEYNDEITDKEGNPIAKRSAVGKVDEIGNTEKNRVQIEVSSNEKNDRNTGVHEFGHTAGLEHEKYDKSVTENNYMWSERNEHTNKVINKTQLQKMDDFIKDIDK